MAKDSRILIIAGFDPSGGAGIVADLETIHKLGGKASAAVTAVTIQNSKMFREFMHFQPENIENQLSIIFDEFRIVGVKIGMMGNRSVAEAIGKILEKKKPPKVVLDPIFKSTTGMVLNDDMTINVMKEIIFPFTTAITPNREEAVKLLGENAGELSSAKIAMNLYEKYKLKSVIITGNERKESSYDVVYDGENTNVIQTKKVKARYSRGTGCRHSSALTYYLSKGVYLNESALLAKDHILGYLSAQR